jgi:hypothetical protein
VKKLSGMKATKQCLTLEIYAGILTARGAAPQRRVTWPPGRLKAESWVTYCTKYSVAAQVVRGNLSQYSNNDGPWASQDLLEPRASGQQMSFVMPAQAGNAEPSAAMGAPCRCHDHLESKRVCYTHARLPGPKRLRDMVAVVRNKRVLKTGQVLCTYMFIQPS